MGMTVKETIEILRGAPQDWPVGAGSDEQGSGEVKYVDIDGVVETVTLWNITREEVEATFGDVHT
jgi:hypothetical protein